MVMHMVWYDIYVNRLYCIFLAKCVCHITGMVLYGMVC